MLIPTSLLKFKNSCKDYFPKKHLLVCALAVDMTDGRGPSSEARCWLLPKKSKVASYVFAIHFTV